MTSPFVQRNLDNAQYAQPRGSQYEGPRSAFEEENDNVFEDAGERFERLAEEQDDSMNPGNWTSDEDCPGFKSIGIGPSGEYEDICYRCGLGADAHTVNFMVTTDHEPTIDCTFGYGGSPCWQCINEVEDERLDGHLSGYAAGYY